MLDDLLRRFDDFRLLAREDRATVARHAQVLVVPGGRWLVQPGRRPPGHYYLVRGKVRTLAPERRFGHRSSFARGAVFPGVAGLRTLVSSQILHVATDAVGFLLTAQRGAAPHATDHRTSAPADDRWLEQFLSSRLMAQLSPAQWQRVVAGFRRRVVNAGDKVVEQGAVADAFYVLVSGRARVIQDDVVIREVLPGDYFGEDGLILSGRRNADVVMVSDGALMLMPADAFTALLLNKVVHCRADRVGGELINVGRRPLAGALQINTADVRARLSELSSQQTYYVVGGSPAECKLTAFIMAQAGLQLFPLLEV